MQARGVDRKGVYKERQTQSLKTKYSTEGICKIDTCLICVYMCIYIYIYESASKLLVWRVFIPTLGRPVSFARFFSGFGVSFFGTARILLFSFFEKTIHVHETLLHKVNDDIFEPTHVYDIPSFCVWDPWVRHANNW